LTTVIDAIALEPDVPYAPVELIVIDAVAVFPVGDALRLTLGLVYPEPEFKTTIPETEPTVLLNV
jgi:hypothetical protein